MTLSHDSVIRDRLIIGFKAFNVSVRIQFNLLVDSSNINESFKNAFKYFTFCAESIVIK